MTRGHHYQSAAQVYTFLRNAPNTGNALGPRPGNRANLRGPLDDADADGWNNLLEFAIDLPPAGGAMGPLSHAGNVITPGTPIVSGTTAVFVRRKSHAAERLVYTVEFSPDLDDWTPDRTVPSVLADDGVHQVVAVPMPLAPAQHFRVVVRLTP